MTKIRLSRKCVAESLCTLISAFFGVGPVHTAVATGARLRDPPLRMDGWLRACGDTGATRRALRGSRPESRTGR